MRAGRAAGIQQHALTPTPEPDRGLFTPMYRWTEGKNLAESLRGTDIAAGDFVRWAKQTLDLLGQCGVAGARGDVDSHGF